MSTRSELLVHWTGKKQVFGLTDESRITDAYVDLIRRFYTDGLRFSLPHKDEIVHGAGTGSAPIPRTGMICFTELRLSDVEKHTDQYGRLGIGFRRNWLMDHGANPVFYIRNAAGGVVNTNLANQIIPQAGRIEGLGIVLSFLKLMSEIPDGNLTYYDEMEWRMVPWKLFSGNPPREVPSPDWLRWDGDTAYFMFSPGDVAIIIAPDEKTRKAILGDSQMKRHFASHLPMMVDADNCDQF